MVHEDGLGEDLAEDHIQHGTAGEAQAQTQAQGADLAQPETQQGTEHRGSTGQGRDHHGLPLGHAAADEGHGHGHAFGDVVQGNGEYHERSALEVGVGALSLILVGVQVGDKLVQSQQKQGAEPYSHKGGQKRLGGPCP